MEDGTALQNLLTGLQQALIPPTRSAAQLPSSSDLSFERTLSRALSRNLDAECTKILELAQTLLDWTTAGTATSKVELDSDLIRDGEYSALTLRVEQLLEHADEHIEKHLGTGKHKKQTRGAVGAKSFEEMEEKEKSRQKIERLPARLLHDSSLPKPQALFTTRTRFTAPSEQEEEVTNTAIPLWKPILTTKLNPLSGETAEGWLETELYEPTSKFTPITDTKPPAYTRYIHPYKRELENLQAPQILLPLPTETPAPIPKDSFDKTPFQWVGTREMLVQMVEEIRRVGQQGCKELAIDLEHHDYRSWSGFTCLIQLSTRQKDYVIDTIDPEVRESLEMLNEFFTDPSWIKVLHGANSDVVWLQRDFGLYIIGLFDTYHATHVLGYAQHSLASLLDMYTDFEPDKRYQLADWRIRPLPKEMLHYARSDTHYLLNIYDHLRLALSSKSSDDSSPTALEEVFNRSTGVSATVFSLPPYDHETGHFESGFLIPLSKSGQIKSYSTALSVPTLPIKTGWGPGEVRLEVLRSLMKWREMIARKEDESTRYVMGIQGVLQVVEQCKRIHVGGSAELVRVLGLTRGGVSEIVRKNKEELVDVIKGTIEAVEGDATGTEDHDMTDGLNLASLNSLIGGLPAFEPAVKPVAGLWDFETVAPAASTSTSSFFGSSVATGSSSSTSSPSLIAANSSFFGPSVSRSENSRSQSIRTAKNGKGKQPLIGSAEARLAAVKRVHENLVLGGALAKSLQPHSLPVPVVEQTPSTQSSAQATSSVDANQLPVPLPLPDASFVAFESNTSAPKAIGSISHAQSVEAKPKDSEVIVVSSLKDKPSRSSQTLAKKRRRAGTEIEPPSAAVQEGRASDSTSNAVSPPPRPPQAKKQKKKKSQSGNTPEVTQPIVPHDYTGSTSILDAGPAVLTGLERREAEKKQKKKDKAAAGGTGKGFKVDTSEFKRPMRVDNAPKKANVSRTFKN